MRASWKRARKMICCWVGGPPSPLPRTGEGEVVEAQAGVPALFHVLGGEGPGADAAGFSGGGGELEGFEGQGPEAGAIWPSAV